MDVITYPSKISFSPVHIDCLNLEKSFTGHDRHSANYLQTSKSLLIHMLKYKYKYIQCNKCHERKCIWKCRLRNDSHFVSAWMCYQYHCFSSLVLGLALVPAVALAQALALAHISLSYCQWRDIQGYYISLYRLLSARLLPMDILHSCTKPLINTVWLKSQHGQSVGWNYSFLNFNGSTLELRNG